MINDKKKKEEGMEGAREGIIGRRCEQISIPISLPLIHMQEDKERERDGNEARGGTH